MLITSCNDLTRYRTVFDTDKLYLMSVPCTEPDGVVDRQVYLLRHPPSMGWLWERVQNIPSLFSTDPKALPIKLATNDFKGWLFFQVDDVGLLAGGTTILQGFGDVHITFWDKRLRGRELLCRRIADWYIEHMGLLGVFTWIPSRSRATLAFAKRVGFRELPAKPIEITGADGAPDWTITLIYGGDNGR